MTKKDLDCYNVIEEGKFKGSMYVVNDAGFELVDHGKRMLKVDYDVINLPEGKEQEFDQWIAKQVHDALIYAVENDNGE